MTARQLSPRRQVAVGLLVMAVGLGYASLAASHLGKAPDTLVMDAVAGSLAGLAFALAGAILVVPERRPGIRSLIGALMVTCVAMLFDWVAFGPGERRFRGGVSFVHIGAASPLSDMSGQALFAIGAVLFNLLALWAWVRTRRTAGRKPRKTARA